MSTVALKLVAAKSEAEALSTLRLPPRPLLGETGRAILHLFR